MTNLLAILTLAIGVPLNAYVVVLLVRLDRESANPVVHDRGIAALAAFVVAVVFGLIFLQNDGAFGKPPPLDGEATKLITRVTVLLVAVVPAVLWIRLYRRNGGTSHESEQP